MKNKLSTLFSLGICLFSPVILLADEPNEPEIKMLHIFIQADVNKVYFENIWVFERQAAAGHWQVSVDLPDKAVVLGFDEPNETKFAAETGSVRKKMAVDSLIDSVGFSFALPNDKGMCRTSITPGCYVDSMVVYVSGSAAKLVSDTLAPSEYMQSHSRFSGVYTAGGLAAGKTIEITLSRLPHKDRGLVEIICLAGLGLLIMVALLTLYYNSKAIRMPE